jgi:hypothetical protein
MSLYSLTIIVVCVISTTSSARTFRITNNCNQKIYMGVQGKPLVKNGGFVVNARGSVDISVPDGWVCTSYFSYSVRDYIV